MFMHAGFAMLETGCCRAKNASNVLMKNLVNVCCGTLGWWSLGWAFAYGGGEAGTNGFISTSGFFGLGFYTQDATTGVITPVATCDSSGCQSTMLSWFFQWVPRHALMQNEMEVLRIVCRHHCSCCFSSFSYS